MIMESKYKVLKKTKFNQIVKMKLKQFYRIGIIGAKY